MIRCPRCANTLRPFVLEKGAVHSCNHCGGVFASAEECATLLGPLVDVSSWRGADWAKFGQQSRLISPKTGQNMEHVEISWAGNTVELDLCPQTGALWFDAGEMKKVSEITRELAQVEEGSFRHLHSELGVKNYLIQLLLTLPMELCNPVRKRPIVTHSLIFLCSLFFIWQLSVPDIEASTRMFALVPEVLQGEQVWGMVTYMFMHGDIFHILGNMFMLYVFGDNIEDVLGRKTFLMFYLACGVAGAMLQLGFQTSSLMVVGASGAIAGVMGAYLVLYPKVKVRMVVLFVPFFFKVQYYLLFWIAWNFLGLLDSDGGVALLCHIGGFVCGMALAVPYRNYDIQEELRT